MSVSDSTDPTQVSPEYLACRLASARRRGHRLALVLSGGHAWRVAQARRYIEALGINRSLWLGAELDAPEEHRAPGRAHTVLGREYDAVVMDAGLGFDADDFGVLSGVLRGGGLFMILAPDFSDWVHVPDAMAEKMRVAGVSTEEIRHRFIRRLVGLIKSDEGVLIIRDGELQPLAPCVYPDAVPVEMRSIPAGPYATSDQEQAVREILEIGASREPAALVLIADRGRGKSSALGIAAAMMLKADIDRIVVTAPRLRAVDAVFEHARKGLPEARYTPGLLEGVQGRLSFHAPDALLRDPVDADLLIIDEAAGIPGQLLQRLLRPYPRVVYATTVHGYEGSGRGFELRFARVLDRERPGWRRMRMEQPVRWSEQDPLEAFSFRALLMDARPAAVKVIETLDTEACRVECIDRDALLADEPMLRELFGLLVTAHYRTRPFDLRYLLDAPNVSIYILRCQGHVTATAMLAEEGGFDAQTSLAIFAGLRRPRGHLLAQSLSAHVGVEDAPRYRYLRVVRIAVHPELQGRGLGSLLLDGIIEAAAHEGMDAIGASFSADDRVLDFWLRRGFHAVHVGIGQEHSSGSHPVMVLHALSAQGGEIVHEARQRFTRRLPILLEDALSGIDSALRDSLLSGLPEARGDLSGMHELIAFADAARGFEVSLYVIFAFVRDQMGQGPLPELQDDERRLLELRVLQHQDWKQVVQALGLSGRREAIAMMRQTLAGMIDQVGDITMRDYRDRLRALKRD